MIRRLVDRFERGFVAVNRGLLVAMLAAMAAIIFANVVLRYATAGSIVWAEEVARHLMIWLTFLGAGLALRHGAHIAIDNLHDGLPRRAAQFVRAAIVVALAVFFVAMIAYGLGYVMRTLMQTTPATQIPFGYVYAAMPVGFAFMLAHLLLVARDYVRDREYRASEEAETSPGLDASSAP